VNTVNPTLNAQFLLCMHLHTAAIVGKSITKGKRFCLKKENTKMCC